MSLMCHKFRRIKAEEELGRLSLGESFSSVTPSPRLLLLEWGWGVPLPTVQTEHSSEGWHRKIAIPPNYRLLLLLLRGGKSRFVQFNSTSGKFLLVGCEAFLMMSTALSQCFQLTKCLKLSRTSKFLEASQISRGDFGDDLSVMDRSRACEPLYGWHDRG